MTEAIAKREMSPAEQTAKRALLHVLASGTATLRGFMSEEVHVDLEALVKDNSFTVQQPFLFLGKHESWYDFVNFPPIWFDFPEEVLFTGPCRTDYFPKIPLLNAVVERLLGLIFFPVYRTWTKGDASPEELKWMHEHNRKALGKVVEAYSKGMSIALMPEGTTKTDGRIAKIRSGAYKYYCSVAGEINCVPIGTTYDFFAGKKPLVFIRFGKPYKYERSARGEETEEAYWGRDMAVFNRRISDHFIALNTITMSQLGAGFVYYCLAEGRKSFTERDMEDMLKEVVPKIQEAGIYYDQALANEGGRKKRMKRFLDALEREKYVTRKKQEFLIDARRSQCRPKNVEQYKAENLLLYQYHRLHQVAELRPHVAAILEKRIGSMKKY